MDNLSSIQSDEQGLADDMTALEGADAAAFADLEAALANAGLTPAQAAALDAPIAAVRARVQAAAAAAKAADPGAPPPPLTS